MDWYLYVQVLSPQITHIHAARYSGSYTMKNENGVQGFLKMTVLSLKR